MKKNSVCGIDAAIQRPHCVESRVEDYLSLKSPRCVDSYIEAGIPASAEQNQPHVDTDVFVLNRGNILDFTDVRAGSANMKVAAAFREEIEGIFDREGSNAEPERKARFVGNGDPVGREELVFDHSQSRGQHRNCLTSCGTATCLSSRDLSSRPKSEIVQLRWHLHPA